MLNENGGHAGKSCEDFCYNEEQGNLAGAEEHVSSAEHDSAWFLFLLKVGSIAAYLYAEGNALVEREALVIHDGDHCSPSPWVGEGGGDPGPTWRAWHCTGAACHLQ